MKASILENISADGSVKLTIALEPETVEEMDRVLSATKSEVADMRYRAACVMWQGAVFARREIETRIRRARLEASRAKLRAEWRAAKDLADYVGDAMDSALVDHLDAAE